MVSLEALLTVCLLSAASWDADGNPATDNLPPIVLTKDIDAHETRHGFEVTDDTEPLTEHRLSGRRRCRRGWAERESAWRTVAAPQRGP